MKLKFRAEKKDWTIFGIFSLVLFYIVSIGVLNAISFIDSGTFSGLNPFPIFTHDYFALAMIIYIALMIAIISSVSSTFFEREKGIGIKSSPKDEKGYSRWAKDKEFKSQLKMLYPTDEKTEYGGIPLINTGKELWVDNSGYHNMIIGSTGSGKSQALSFPFIRVMAKAGESMIVTDPKGELYEGTAKELEERGYNIILLNFRDPQKGNCWNPFYLTYKLYKEGNIDKATELLEDLAKNILYDESSKGQDPFWENTSADYFTGLTLALFDDAKEEEININSINLMSTVGEEKIGATTYIKEYFSDKDQTSGAYVNASSTLMAPTDTKGSILSVFKQKIKLFSSRKNLSEMLSCSDFDIEDIGRKKTAVFIVIQDEKKTYHPLVTIFLKQCYETLVRVAQETGGKLKYRTSYGQNVLNHSIEVSNLARIMAEELGLDAKLARRAGLLHDIGKALDHDMEGTHVELGVEVLKKYKENENVINAVQAHHGDVEPKTIEAVLVQAADAISASRPGARRETLEAYIKRLEQLEGIADSFEGVEKSFAIQAGREIRIIVKPDKIDDNQMKLMARDIAKRVEDEMEYPGQIKVNVVRETRVIDYAK